MPGGANDLWSYPIAGRGTPVIANDRLYGWGYRGEGPDLQEFLFCLNAVTGEFIWEIGFNDFLSDIVYDRYSIGSPTVDPESGAIFIQTTPGILCRVSPDGKIEWQCSMMEEYGRLTFPNGRTGAPVIDGDLVIVHGITSNWGSDGPGRDRFYAFDKTTGDLVWSTTPGETPKDSSFGTPYLDWENGKRVLYCGTGCGNIVCINVKTGEPIWRFTLSRVGVNSSIVRYDDRVFAIHDGENLDTTETGRMVAIKVGAQPKAGEAGPAIVGQDAELWRNNLSMFTGSPVLADERLYQVDKTGVLSCIDVHDGKIIWQEKLNNDQLHASPLYADGKLYIPFPNGLFYIIRPSDKGPEILCKTQLEGSALGSPCVWKGRIYVHTTAKLYCFGGDGTAPKPVHANEQQPRLGQAVKLQIVPAEVLMRPNESMGFKVWKLDANGFRLGPAANTAWDHFIPPTAKVKAMMDAEFDRNGELKTTPSAKISAGAYQAVSEGLKGTIRGRVLPKFPYREDFESFDLNVPHEIQDNVMFAYPPLPWIGARFKWEIQEYEGSKVLVKTLDNTLFQRAITFIGHPDESNYTMQADVMTDGNRRNLSDVGVINQRYVIALVGNWQQIQVISNQDRIKVGVPFTIKPKTWYRLKTRVDVAEDGSGVVRGKAWSRDEAEPEAWTIEVPHRNTHKQGAPGLYGFALQSQFHVYVDNVEVSSNQ